MKNIKKISLFIVILLTATLILPVFSNATTREVATEEALIQAVEDAENEDVISLTANIVLTKPLEIEGKHITINANGNTVSRNSENWTPNGQNSSLITAGKPGTELHLMNIKLENSAKYGVQSYDGAYVILDNVTISNCAFGGVLINAGTVEIRSLNLGKNGTTTDNGIEIAKGDGVYTDGTKPILIMNGSLSWAENGNVLYVDIVDGSNGFEIQNIETSKNKVFFNDNKLAITNENNEIVFQSAEIANVDVKADNYVPTPAPEPTPAPAPVTAIDTTPKTGADNGLLLAIVLFVISGMWLARGLEARN